MWDIPHDPGAKGFWPLPKRTPAKFQHKYGYYECRCRLQQHDGWWSAFWLQSPTQGVSLDARSAGLECDVMESFKPGQVGRHMLHRNGYGPDYKGFDSHRLGPAPTPEETEKTYSYVDKTAFHTFGVLWEPDGYTFFVDGKMSGWKVGGGNGEAVSQTEQFILISTECKWYRQNKMTGKPVPELDGAIPDCFTVDHVRVFDVVE